MLSKSFETIATLVEEDTEPTEDLSTCCVCPGGRLSWLCPTLRQRQPPLGQFATSAPELIERVSPVVCPQLVVEWTDNDQVRD